MADVKEAPQESSGAPPQTKAKPAVLPDPAYEFSAPRFYDFATNSQDRPDAERADAWFDTATTQGKRANTQLVRTFCYCATWVCSSGTCCVLDA